MKLFLVQEKESDRVARTTSRGKLHEWMEDWDEMNQHTYRECYKFSESGRRYVTSNEHFGRLRNRGFDGGMRESAQQAAEFNESIQKLQEQ